MKNRISILFFLVFTAVIAYSQDDQPADPAFEGSTLIDNQTVTTPYKGLLEFNILHRFGTVKNGITDIYGIYAPSNIKLGFNYGITDKIMVGVGTTKDYKLQDLQWKYALLQQTQSGRIPVSVSYFGNAVLDARAKDAFGPEDRFKEIHRLSYFSQLIVARRFNDKFSLQVAPGFIYYNAVEEGLKNGNLTLHAGGRAKIIGYNSIVVEYDQLLTSQDSDQPKPNVSLGYEIGTGTHVFQVFVANYSGIINQRNLLYNSNDFSKGEFLFGFNITVKF